MDSQRATTTSGNLRHEAGVIFSFWHCKQEANRWRRGDLRSTNYPTPSQPGVPDPTAIPTFPRSVPYLARNPTLAGERNSVDDPRCLCSFARCRNRWVFARNEVLRFARDIGRIALGRHSIRGGSTFSCHLRSSTGGVAILHRMAQASFET